MNPGLIVKLRPVGAWRSGPDSGARNRIDPIYHSDSVYAAVTAAMATLGMREEWLDATARNAEGPAVRFSSCFPFVGETGLVVPPRNIWPLAPGAASSAAKVRWKSARFVPLPLVAAVLGGQPVREDQWTVDGVSECLVPVGQAGPFRIQTRWNGAVDRLTGSVERHATACVQFRRDAGLWAIVSFTDDAAVGQWSGPVRGALRLLADSGFGGERSRGWGRCAEPEFVEGTLPGMILPEVAAETRGVGDAETRGHGDAETRGHGDAETRGVGDTETRGHGDAGTPGNGDAETPGNGDAETPLVAAEPAGEITAHSENVAQPAEVPVAAETKVGSSAYWLLSLFAPGPSDTVDWARGNYTVVTRGGRIQSPAGFGEAKKQLQMVTEGSVLVANDGIRGAAPDVAPDGFAHPVFRAGFALSIPLPGQGNA